MISSLPGKASRTLVESRGKAEPGKLDTKRCKPGILFISLQVGSLFKLYSDYEVIIVYLSIQRRFNAIDDDIQKVQRILMFP